MAGFLSVERGLAVPQDRTATAIVHGLSAAVIVAGCAVLQPAAWLLALLLASALYHANMAWAVAKAEGIPSTHKRTRTLARAPWIGSADGPHPTPVSRVCIALRHR
jgi:hypothetical protein